MHYRIRQALFDLLTEDERSIAWLARRISYTPQHVRTLWAGINPVTERFARRVAAALERDIDDLFEPIDGTEGGDAHDG